VLCVLGIDLFPRRAFRSWLLQACAIAVTALCHSRRPGAQAGQRPSGAVHDGCHSQPWGVVMEP